MGKQGSSYEQLAKVALGKKWKPVVSITMLTSLLGFVVAYMTLVSTPCADYLDQNHGPSIDSGCNRAGHSALLALAK